MRKRQDSMSAAIHKDLAEKTGGSIKSLKKMLPGNSDAMEDDNEEESDNEAEVAVPEVAHGENIAKAFKLIRRNPKTRGSKPRKNPGKELVWFK